MKYYLLLLLSLPFIIILEQFNRSITMVPPQTTVIDCAQMQDRINRAKSPDDLKQDTATALRLAIYATERIDFFQIGNDSETLHFDELVPPLDKVDPTKYKWLSYLVTSLDLLTNNKKEDWSDIALQTVYLFLFDLGAIKGDQLDKRQSFETQKEQLLLASNELAQIVNIMWDSSTALNKSQRFYRSLEGPLQCPVDQLLPDHLELFEQVEFLNKPDPFQKYKEEK